MNPWDQLAQSLRSRYPEDWSERYQSYKDGTNADLKAWRAIGGERYDPAAPPERNGKRGPKHGFTFVPDPRLVARNKRIQSAHAAGVPLQTLMDRFGLAKSTICAVVSRVAERAQR